MNDLTIIFSQLQVNDTDKINEATRIITEMEQDIRTLELVAHVISTNSNDFIRLQAVISVKRMLELHWPNIYNISGAENIRTKIFNLIQNETNTQILYLLIHAIEPIFKYTKEFLWPELDQFALSLLESENVTQLDAAFKLIGIMLPYKEPELILRIIPKISKTIDAAFRIDNPELICSASDLISSLIQLFDTLPNDLENLYNLLSHVYENAVINSSPYLYRLSYAINNTVCKSGVISPISQIQFLLTLAINEYVDPSQLFYIFDPISTIISMHIEVILKYGLIPDLLKIIYQSTVRCFVDDYLNEQSDCEFIISIIEIIIPKMDSYEIYGIIENFLMDDSANTQFATLLVFQVFIDYSPDIVADNLPTFISFIIEHSTNDNHVCVREESLVCIQHLIRTVNGGLKYYFNEILNSCIQALSSQDEQIIYKGLESITELLSTLTIPKESISYVYEILTNLAVKGIFLESVITSLSALVFSASENIIEYFDILYDMFMKCAMVNEEEHPLLKSSAIKGLVYLFLASPENSKNIITFICELTKNESISYSALPAFVLLTKAAVPELSEYLATPMKLVESIFKEDLPENPSEDEFDSYSSLFEEITGAINLFHYLVKNYSIEVNEELIEMLRKFSSHQVPEIQINSIKALTQLCIKYQIDSFNELIELFDSDDPFVVSTLFKSFTKTINSNLCQRQEIISLVLDFAFQGIEKELHCQKDENEFDIDLIMSIFKFMSSVALKLPDSVPVGRIIDLLKLHHNDQYVRVFGSEVLSSLIIGNEQLDLITKEEIVELIIDDIEDCDGTIQPVPLHSIRLILETDPNLFNNTFSNISELMVLILRLENEGQPAYSETVAAAASFLYTICRMAGSDYIKKYIPLLLELDLVTDPKESQNIYESQIIIINNYEEVLEPYFPQLYNIFSLLFSMDRQVFQRMNISENLIENLIQMHQYFRSKLNILEENDSSIIGNQKHDI